jgi:hypothetical protein
MEVDSVNVHVTYNLSGFVSVLKIYAGKPSLVPLFPQPLNAQIFNKESHQWRPLKEQMALNQLCHA